MKRVFPLIFCLVVNCCLSAQPDVCKSNYTKKLDEGISLFNNGKYREAARTFSDAHCPAITTAQHVGLDEWASKCVDALNKRKRKTIPKKNLAKPEVEILYSGYIKAVCKGNLRGAELKVVISTKNLKGHTIDVVCIIASMTGSENVLAGTDSTGIYTAQDGKSGQKQHFFISDHEEYTTINFFVPFNVMDYDRSLLWQNLNSTISVTVDESQKTIAQESQTYESIETYTFTFRKGTRKILGLDYMGGFIEWTDFASCEGNKVEEIIITRMPNWITRDEDGIHVAENPSPSPRTATLKASLVTGGNSVEIIIKQQGRQ